MFGDFDWVVASDMRLSSHIACYRLDLNEAEIAFGGNLNSWKLNAMDWLECIGVVETANRPNIVVFPWFDIFCPYWFDYAVAVFHTHDDPSSMHGEVRLMFWLYSIKLLQRMNHSKEWTWLFFPHFKMKMVICDNSGCEHWSCID